VILLRSTTDNSDERSAGAMYILVFQTRRWDIEVYHG